MLKPCESDNLIFHIERCFEKLEAFKKIKIYEEILPICMYCKDIRDDTGKEPGKGEWLQLEAYLSRKSGVDISHGVCPKCYEKQCADL